MSRRRTDNGQVVEMRVKTVSLKNFRNYESAKAELCPKRNIVIGDNAQGKTNFLEAIEIVARGGTPRANRDSELIRRGSDRMHLEIAFESRGFEEKVALSIAYTGTSKAGLRTTERQVKINGLSQAARTMKKLLVCVSFKSQDLNLLRGGPSYRRDWLDGMLTTIRPTAADALNRYAKVVTQRNRLLKNISERGRVTVTDQDELRVWDAQLTKLGAHVIKCRVALLDQLLPAAEKHQEHLSGNREILSASYLFKVAADRADAKDSDDLAESEPDTAEEGVGLQDLIRASEEEIAQRIMRQLKQRRAEEIARKQSVVGPHRDDIDFRLDGVSATSFASQGQQRSLVLSFKLAELACVTEVLEEPPILLLDDVLAELDLKRQAQLMSLVDGSMQTIITTTHVDSFQPQWLDHATFFRVESGSLAIYAHPVAI